MDDLELEARLRTHLHRRLDDAPIPAGLASNVSQALTTAARPVGLATRTGRIRIGWAAVAAAVVIALGAIALEKGLGPTGPGATSTPTPQATTAPERYFIVLPPGMAIDKPAAILATTVLAARIQALGIGAFSSGGGYGIQFTLPSGGPSDASIRTVLGATGDVRFVPLPTADYGAGKLTATIGQPLPRDEPALFGWDGIASVTIGISQQGEPDLSISLKPVAAQAFGDYASSHVAETVAIVVDGRTAVLIPTPITNGQIGVSLVQVNVGSGVAEASVATAAILVGGLLPEAWQGASVPVIVSRDQAIVAALAATHGGTVLDASPTVDETHLAGELQAVWYVDVYQPNCPDNESCISMYLQVRVDAVTGVVIDMAPSGSSAAP